MFGWCSTLVHLHTTFDLFWAFSHQRWAGVRCWPSSQQCHTRVMKIIKHCGPFGSHSRWNLRFWSTNRSLVRYTAREPRVWLQMQRLRVESIAYFALSCYCSEIQHLPRLPIIHRSLPSSDYNHFKGILYIYIIYFLFFLYIVIIICFSIADIGCHWLIKLIKLCRIFATALTCWWHQAASAAPQMVHSLRWQFEVVSSTKTCGD